MSNEPVESWWVPEYLPMDDVCDWLTKICLSHQLPEDLPRGPQDLFGDALRLINEGLSKKEIKQRLHWSVLRKKLGNDEITQIEQQIDQALKDRPSAIRQTKLMSEDKIAKMRQMRSEKIIQLIEAGKTDAQIRNNMKVYDKKQAWHETEALWFETILVENRNLRDAS
jgi:hypothetical protein